MKFRFDLLLKAIVSLVLLGLVLRSLDLSQLQAQLQRLTIPFLLFALCYYTVSQWVSCLRWQIVLHAIGRQVKIQKLIKSYFGGMFLNLILPGNMGGDVYRVYQVSQYIQDSEAGFSSVLLERFVGLVAMLGLGMLGLPLLFRVTGRWDMIVLFALCTGVIWAAVLLIVSPRLLDWVKPALNALRLGNLVERFAKIQHILRQFGRDRQAVAIAIVLSLIFNLSVIYYQYLVAQQLQVPLSYPMLLVITPILVVMTLIPISLGGIGLNESVRAFLFSRVGVPVEQAIVLSLVYTALSWILSIPGGLILLTDLGSSRSASAKLQSKNR